MTPKRPAAAAAPRAWTNWARTERVVPARRVRPRDAGEVADAVRAAVVDGLTVRAVGAGHSSSGVAVAAGLLVDTSALTGVRDVDRAAGLVEVGAGTRLHALSPALWERGLALPSLGDIDRQSLAGALATGTHGSGLAWGGIAAAVEALELVTPDGAVVRCSRTRWPALFDAARVGLGAFGIVTAVTLRCVPAFGVAAAEQPVPLARFLDTADDLMARHDHVEALWFPHTDTVLQLTKDHLPAAGPLAPQPRWRAVLEETVLANAGLGALCRVGAALPGRVPALNRFATRLMSARAWSDRSYRVFANDRRVRFRELEYAVPLETWREVFAQVRRVVERPGTNLGFPVDLRFTGADDPWLSMAYGRRTAWLSVQPYWRMPHEAVHAACEPVFAAHAGRPHWGKLHGLDVGALRALYPRFDDALAVRDEVDPGRVLANPYVRRVLGA